MTCIYSTPRLDGERYTCNNDRRDSNSCNVDARGVPQPCSLRLAYPRIRPDHFDRGIYRFYGATRDDPIMDLIVDRHGQGERLILNPLDDRPITIESLRDIQSIRDACNMMLASIGRDDA